MTKLLAALTALLLAASFALPLNAAPIFVPKHEQVQTGAVEQVRHRRHWRAERHWIGGTLGFPAVTTADAILAITDTTAIVTTTATTGGQESPSILISSDGRS
ncbi:hypothetical protein EV184_102448 [Sinorhizobium americanum]|uniref:Uncharacterized protein n=1 Tax=Sinorhizobium americanum TaxID=194963 RepID=A0A4R2C1R5_9HYPH|nr:hypothetical protein EV184_102448 [Sinorhizobium americanum]